MSLLGRIGTFNRRLELHRRADVNNGRRAPSGIFIPTNQLCDSSIARLGYESFYNAGCSEEIVNSPAFKTLDNMISGMPTLPCMLWLHWRLI